MDAYAILGFFAVMGLVGWLAAGRRYQRPTVSPAWRRLAKRMDGTIRPARPDGQPGRPRSPALRVTHEGVQVEAKLVELESNDDMALLTCITADAQNDDGFTVSVSRRGALASLERALGTEVIATGDSDFDRECQVQSPTPHRVQAWLDGPLRRAITASTGYSFSMAEGRIAARRSGRDDDERRMVAAMTAVARLARRGKDLRLAWGRLANKLGGTVAAESTTWPTIEIELDAVTVAVTVEEPTDGDSSACMRIATKPLGRLRERFAVARSLPLWSAGLDPMDGGEVVRRGSSAVSADPAKTGVWIERHAALLASARPDSLTHDGQLLSVTLNGISMDEVRLRNAVALVAALGSRDEQGPYR
jgi:hypothetical protein